MPTKLGNSGFLVRLLQNRLHDLGFFNGQVNGIFGSTTRTAVKAFQAGQALPVTGIVNAGGSFGQFSVIPLAQLFIGLAGWQPAMVLLGLLSLGAVPLLLWLTRGQAEHAAAHPAARGRTRTASR